MVAEAASNNFTLENCQAENNGVGTIQIIRDTLVVERRSGLTMCHKNFFCFFETLFFLLLKVKNLFVRLVFLSCSFHSLKHASLKVSELKNKV